MRITPSRIDELAIALTDPHVEVVAMKRETAEELLVEIEALCIERSVARAQSDSHGLFYGQGRPQT